MIPDIKWVLLLTSIFCSQSSLLGLVVVTDIVILESPLFNNAFVIISTERSSDGCVFVGKNRALLPALAAKPGLIVSFVYSKYSKVMWQ